MTKRENVLSLVKRQGYDFVPTFYPMCPYLKTNFAERLEVFKQKHGIPDCFVNSKGIEFEIESDEVRSSYFNPPLKENSTIDIMGMGHEPGSEAAMHMTYLRSPLEHMETLEEIEAYPYATPIVDEQYLEKIKKENDKIKANDQIVMGRMGQTIWERAWGMRRMENLMVDMLCEEEIAEFILDKITEIAIFQAEFLAKVGCDILWVGDDIGMQHSTMMSEDTYTTWLKPRLVKVIKAAKKINPEIIIFYHSCGFVEPFINHLIDAGIEILNPIQPECMDFAQIEAKYGDRVSFHGTIGTQTTMPFGTPQEVRELVFKNLDLAGEKGGLLIAPTHLLEPEVPVENIEAYLLACHEYKPNKGERNV